MNLKLSLLNCRESSTALFLIHNEIEPAIAIKKIKFMAALKLILLLSLEICKKSGKK